MTKPTDIRTKLREREQALGIAGDTLAQRAARADAAMRQAFWNLEMAEKREQPAFVLDQMFDRYLARLADFNAAMRAVA